MKLHRLFPLPSERRTTNEWDAVQAGIDQCCAGKYDDALKILGSYVVVHLSDSQALTELGKVYDLRGDRDTAHSCYQRVAGADAWNREAIARMNAYLVDIPAEIDADASAKYQPSGVVMKKKQ